MRRMGYFWNGLSLASRFQFFGFVLLLGFVFVVRDMNPRLRVVGVPLWQVTGPLILMMFLLGRALLPIMLWRPNTTQRLLSWFGMAVFVVGLLGAWKPWGRLLITHLGLTSALWLDVSCSFWFISEIQRRAFLMMQSNAAALDNEDLDSKQDEEEAGR